MGKYRPVPRTLSEIIRKVSQSPPSAAPRVELLSPEQLRAAAQVSMLDPTQLFEGVTILPTPPTPEIKTPDKLFGKQAFAKPGQPLKGLAEMLPVRRQPTNPLPTIRPPQTGKLKEPSPVPRSEPPPEPNTDIGTR